MMMKGCNAARVTRAGVTSKPAFFRPKTTVVRAEPEGEKLSFTPSTKAAEGFILEDSAGQTNMFPSVMKPYEAGSSADKEDGSVAVVGASAAAVAIAAIAAGLFLGQQGPPAPVALGNYETASFYSTKFAAELGLKSAPNV